MLLLWTTFVETRNVLARIRIFGNPRDWRDINRCINDRSPYLGCQDDVVRCCRHLWISLRQTAARRCCFWLPIDGTARLTDGRTPDRYVNADRYRHLWISLRQTAERRCCFWLPIDGTARRTDGRTDTGPLRRRLPLEAASFVTL